MKKEMIGWQSIVIYLTGIIGVVCFLWYASNIDVDDIHFDNEEIYVLSEDWKVITPKGEQIVTLPTNIQAKAGEKIVFSLILEEQPMMCNTILFHSGHQYIKVYLDDTLIMEYGYNQKTPVKMSPGSPWHIVRLPDNWEGKELAIETIAYYDASAGYMEEVYLGTKSALVFKVYNEGKLSLFLIIPVLLTGIVMFVMSFFFHEKIAVRKLKYLGITAIVSSVWIFLESRVTQLVTGKLLLCMNLVFILFALIPVLFIYYLMSFKIFNKSKYMRTLFVISVINYLAIQILRVFGIVDYLYTVPWVHVILIALIAGIIGIYINEKIKKRKLDEESKQILFAVLVLAVFALIDVSRFYMMWVQAEAITFSKVGLFCFVLILGYSAVKQEAKENMNRIEQHMLQKLAYTDMLTGISNRTAFEECMEKYRKNLKNIKPILMITDMNGLKHINDTYGHVIGDNAIIIMAQALMKFFGKRAECFRIGGDEFCVITNEIEEDEFTLLVNQYKEYMQEQKIVSDCYISIACGIFKCMEEGIDSGFVAADKKMYECKASIKREIKSTS